MAVQSKEMVSRMSVCTGMCVVQAGKTLMERKWKEEDAEKREIRDMIEKVLRWVFDMG